MIYENIKLNKTLIEDQCIGLAILFGSIVTGFEQPFSDVDIGIVFSDFEKKRNDPVGVYYNLYEEFKLKFNKDKIDIVYLQETPLSLQFKAITEGIVIYEVNPLFTANYKEHVTKLYLDFKFFEGIFDEVFLRSQTL
jgi:predicted nucleotidyltransferase